MLLIQVMNISLRFLIFFTYIFCENLDKLFRNMDIFDNFSFLSNGFGSLSLIFIYILQKRGLHEPAPGSRNKAARVHVSIILIKINIFLNN